MSGGKKNWNGIEMRKNKLTSHLRFVGCVAILEWCDVMWRTKIIRLLPLIFYSVLVLHFYGSEVARWWCRVMATMKISSIMIFFSQLYLLLACIMVVHSPFCQTATKHINLVKRWRTQIRWRKTTWKNKRFIICFFFFFAK